MKSKLILVGIAAIVVVAVYFFYTDSAKAGDSKVNWNSFDNALEESQKENKKMIVSVYTDWCTWCKKMEKSTYGDSEVYEYLNTNYAATKINAEASTPLKFQGKEYTESELTKAFGISGYPATIFLDEKQEPITVIPGYIQADEFMKILTYIKNDIYKSKSFDEYSNSL